jgi:small-conductance mechanosensitive channel
VWKSLTRIRRSILGEMALATLAALILAPLFMITIGLALVLIVWVTHAPVSVPWILTASYASDTPGGGFDATTGPGFALLVGVVVVMVAGALFRSRRRSVRAATSGAPASDH